MPFGLSQRGYRHRLHQAVKALFLRLHQAVKALLRLHQAVKALLCRTLLARQWYALVSHVALKKRLKLLVYAALTSV